MIIRNVFRSLIITESWRNVITEFARTNNIHIGMKFQSLIIEINYNWKVDDVNPGISNEPSSGGYSVKIYIGNK